MNYLNKLHVKTFNDSKERIKWRTKQVYDYSHLMAYSLRRGVYYLQLEDDLTAKKGFITDINNFIKQQEGKKWALLEFTQMGFIGKLFQIKYLTVFIHFFMAFAHLKPIDWLLHDVFTPQLCKKHLNLVSL